MSQKGERATYRYTAQEQRELDALKARYTLQVKEEQLDEARRIDRAVTRRATIKAVVIGMVGTLIFGAGLSMVLTTGGMVAGIAIGCAGIAVMAAMPAVYERLLKDERRKAAADFQKRIEEAGERGITDP